MSPGSMITRTHVIKAMRKISIAALLACLTAFVSPAAVADGNPEQGRLIAYTCLGCHGIDGYRNAYPSYRVPRLGGQHSDYIVAALKAYRSGERKHPTMRAHSEGLSDQDIMDLAAYLAAGDSVDAGAAVVSKAGQEKAAACAACHGASGVSPTTMMPIAPILAGQHAEYIEQALTQYQKGDRSGGNAAIMTGMAAPLTEDDIKLLAEFFAAQGGLKTTQK